MSGATAESKYGHTDANVIPNVKFRGLTLQNEGGVWSEVALRGISDVVMTSSYDIEGLEKGGLRKS